MIDEAIKKENAKEAIANESYAQMGLLSEKFAVSQRAIGLNAETEETIKSDRIEINLLNEFKELFVELNLHKDKYKQEISHYFGRYYLLEKVKILILILFFFQLNLNIFLF